jgi:predicted HD phosphohydrolase
VSPCWITRSRQTVSNHFVVFYSTSLHRLVYLTIHLSHLVLDSRYLTAIDPAYYDTLSSASKASLEFQGGPFQGPELECFKKDPLSEEMVRLRHWDDAAKVEGIIKSTPRPEKYESMIEEHLRMTSRKS